jgi:hypothetical protein
MNVVRFRKADRLFGAYMIIHQKESGPLSETGPPPSCATWCIYDHTPKRKWSAFGTRTAFLCATSGPLSETGPPFCVLQVVRFPKPDRIFCDTWCIYDHTPKRKWSTFRKRTVCRSAFGMRIVLEHLCSETGPNGATRLIIHANNRVM